MKEDVPAICMKFQVILNDLVKLPKLTRILHEMQSGHEGELRI